MRPRAPLPVSASSLPGPAGFVEVRCGGVVDQARLSPLSHQLRGIFPRLTHDRTAFDDDARFLDHDCFITIRETRGWIFRLAYPQFPTLLIDRAAHLAVSPLQVVREDSTAWGPCSFDPSHECRE